MRYVSTRGGMDPAGFSDVLLAGLAPDGGLVVPETMPGFDGSELDRLRDAPYAEVAFEVCRRFVDGDIPDADLAAIVNDTYRSPDEGIAVFDHPDVVSFRTLGDGTTIAGLSHGPTLAFKDMALQLLGRLFDFELERRNQELTVLGATSGDTGSSAEHAMIGRHRVSVFMLSPLGRTSPFQAAQMFTIDEPNIVNIAVRGVFDDCQDLVKAVNADEVFKSTHHIGAVNSINWARIMAQVAYHLYVALRVSEGGPVDIAVPSGNFGNVYAGHVARRMGAPIDRLIVATNENDVLDEFFTTGRYRVREDVAATSSPSMDISKASNFERYVFDLLGGDPTRTAALFGDLAVTGGFDLSADPAFTDTLGFVSGRSDHALRIATIRSTHVADGVLIDPHTADGLAVGRRHRRPGVPLVCLETARPVKFAATIEEATGSAPPMTTELTAMLDRPQHHETVDADVDAVKAIIAGIPTP